MPKDTKNLKVLFLCTANACRSQMAEGWARHLKSDVIEAYSAGVAPQKVSSRAITVMKEVGVDISGHHSKHVDEIAKIDFDYVITVCDNAHESCPIFPGKTKVIHVGFDDPAAATGTPEEVLAAFRKVRDQIKEFILTLPQALSHKGI
ncbi:MAG: arsenate reductase ArsC [Sedimentisphaerales bacterium]|nr:arsenate reductase ArsC [Sedimentisphaerales bacterium]